MNELDLVGQVAGELGWETSLTAGALWFFGPTLLALRRNVGRWSDFHSANVLKLNQRIQARVREQHGEDEGAVHPRVAQAVIEQAPWISDDVQQEYLAGLLIASRTANGGSERGAYYARMAANLTAQQTRIHQAIYTAVATAAPDVDLDSQEQLRKASVWLPKTVLAEIIIPEGPNVTAEFCEALYALLEIGLVDGFVDPTTDEYRDSVPRASRPCIAVKPTSLGILLYLWARGVRPSDANGLKGPLPPGPTELTRVPSEFFVANIFGEVAPL